MPDSQNLPQNRILWRTGFRAGLIACAPFIAVVIPFSVLFGVVAKDAGLDLLQVMTMSVLVIAGSSQFTAIALLQDHAPVFVVLIASLAVNMRMAMYSAALQPHIGKASLRDRLLMAYMMVDQSFAVSVKTYEERPEMPLAEKVGYYFGCITCVGPFWYAGCFVGALIGKTIPPELNLDFAVPICFISLLAPMLRSLPHIAAALTSCVVWAAFSWLPWNLALIVAGVAGMMVGAQVEFRVARKRAKFVGGAQ